MPIFLPALFADPPPAVETTVFRVARSAMATEFEIILPWENRTDRLLRQAEDALDRIDAIEDWLSIYRESSELSRVNRDAARSFVPLSEPLFELLAFCRDVNRQTQGAFDPACGALSQAWGFHRRAGRIPTASERAEALAASGMRYVILEPQGRRIKFLRSGLTINPGGFGKGYALDCAAELLRYRHGVVRGCLQGGSSSVLAVGTPADGLTGWPIALRHPWRAERIGMLLLRDQGLGTSAATYQHFEQAGKVYGHILDPRTGMPAEGLDQVSVIAPTAALADALSTAFFVLGEKAARTYCENHSDIGAILLPCGTSRPILLGCAEDCFGPSPDPVPTAWGDLMSSSNA